MKALRHLGKGEKKVISHLVNEQIMRERDDIAKRCQYIWVLAMVQVGLSPRTIKRVIGMIPAVTDKYAEYQADEVGDYAMRYLVKEQSGIELPLTTREVEKRG